MRSVVLRARHHLAGECEQNYTRVTPAVKGAIKGAPVGAPSIQCATQPPGPVKAKPSGRHLRRRP